MDVKVGSWSDPKDTPGLAHYFEHLLFMGTAKYPEENDFRKYILTNGGKCNAFTSDTNTNYHFSVDANYLGGALDRY